MSPTRSMRVFAAATFLPAFPLLLVHGVLSHDAVPAVGLVPLCFSASESVFLLVRDARRRRAQQMNGAEEQQEEEVHEDEHEDEEQQSTHAPPAEHPILVFVADAILAAALMIVLVFTWMRTETGRNTSYSMLAAYGTMPLLLNFFIHFYLAVRAIYIGLAVQNLIQYVAWQVVDPDCPNCSHHLRPGAPPSIPWLQSLPSARNVRWPAIRAPKWKTPAWLKTRGGYAPLFSGGRAAEPDTPYHDDEPVGEGSSAPVEPVAVVVKKDKKGKNAPVMGEEPTVWDT